MYRSISANKRNTVVIMAVFLLIIGGLGALAGYAYQSWTVTIAVIIIAMIYALIQFFMASREALAINGAREVSKQDAPELYRIVENLSITEGLPTPKVYIMQDPSPNAFATGRDPKTASVAVTTGLLEIMDKREVTAVLAHEMGHVKNYDILVNLVAFGLVGAIGMLADILARTFLYGKNNRDNKNPIMIVFGLVGLILAPIAATLVQLAISRQREYLADASGALTTRDSEALASALEKLKTHGQPMIKQNKSTASMFFSNPLKKAGGLFQTHPPLDERIKRLRENATKM
ncbi:M48 family metalloprotease [Candidatus Saccharibacteria bacterium]|nr:M48 family metalloprotease [Candidatus Saccharibacteria bacterium]